MNDATMTVHAINLSEEQATRLSKVMQEGNSDNINACVQEIVAEREKQAAIDKMRDMLLRDLVRAAVYFMHQQEGQKAHDLLCIANEALNGNFNDARGQRLSELLNEGLLGDAKDGCAGHA